MQASRSFPLVVAFALAWSAFARAQPIGTSAFSVELAAREACLIVRGTIEDLEEHALSEGLAGDVGAHRYRTVTVRVHETLKGECDERLRFVEDGDWRDVDLADLLREKRELLLFLRPWALSDGSGPARGGYAFARFPCLVDDVILFSPDGGRWARWSLPPMTADGTPLPTQAAAIDAIRSYLNARDPSAPSIVVSTELPPVSRGGYYAAHLFSPSDANVDDPAFREAARFTPVFDFEEFRRRFAKAPPAEAKPPYTRSTKGYVGVDALELMAADCDAIVRATIEDFFFVSRSDDPTGDSYGVRLRVLEPFKGEIPRRIECFIHDAKDLERLRRDEREIVFFLRSGPTSPLMYPEGTLPYRLRETLWDDSAIVLEESQAEVLFGDLTWHRDPREILDRLRSISRNEDARKENADERCSPSTPARSSATFDVHPPDSVAAGSSIEGNPHAVVYLLVDQELEANARRWAESENPDRRWLAARVMVYFKSDENAAILKGMLDDDAAWSRQEMLRLTGLSRPYEPELLVRWEAYHVLAGWGYDVSMPRFVADEPDEPPPSR